MHFVLQYGPIQAQVCIATMVGFGMVMYTSDAIPGQPNVIQAKVEIRISCVTLPSSAEVLFTGSSSLNVHVLVSFLPRYLPVCR